MCICELELFWSIGEIWAKYLISRSYFSHFFHSNLHIKFIFADISLIVWNVLQLGGSYLNHLHRTCCVPDNERTTGTDDIIVL